MSRPHGRSQCTNARRCDSFSGGFAQVLCDIIPLPTYFTAKVISMKNPNPCHPHCILILYGVGNRNYRIHVYEWCEDQWHLDTVVYLMIPPTQRQSWHDLICWYSLSPDSSPYIFAILCYWICTFEGLWWLICVWYPLSSNTVNT